MILTHKQLEAHGWEISTMAIDVLVLQHQAISIHSADLIYCTTDDPYKNITFTAKNTRISNYILIKMTQLFKG